MAMVQEVRSRRITVCRLRGGVQREDTVVREWSGTERLLPGVTLVEAGRHFPGAAVAHVENATGGTLLVGDTMIPVPAGSNRTSSTGSTAPSAARSSGTPRALCAGPRSATSPG
ncbi:hypothetical protein [Amycolatopsis tolypomycina]|uniref:hypothetical protein n=1 Tax=Amycolatopsis tolypomycina TaxID=208445 RepID=UPI001FC98632|nr:hypothetical protein [Amycolatopsis tolypomycina]